jgi:hypothetical protein
MTQKRHVIDYYLDSHVTIAFCKVCSAEGEKLIDDCEGLPLFFCFGNISKEEFDIKYGKPID